MMMNNRIYLPEKTACTGNDLKSIDYNQLNEKLRDEVNLKYNRIDKRQKSNTVLPIISPQTKTPFDEPNEKPVYPQQGVIPYSQGLIWE